MLLGKRPQPPLMRRTTSMSGGMAADMSYEPDHGDVDDHDDSIIRDPSRHHDYIMGHDHGLIVTVPDHHQPLLNMVISPNNPNSHITPDMNNTQKTQYQLITSNPPSPHRHVIQTPQFLRTCGLCKCRLAPGRDIYMYRGDTAFCSLECRDQRMKEDSRKEKRNKMTSNKENHRASPRTTAIAAAKAKASDKGEA